MKALIRKDSDWLLLFALGGALAFTIALGQCFDLWVLRRYEVAQELYLAWWITAAGFGVFAAVREDLSRTGYYLWHRPISRARILGTKLLGCGVVLLVWLLLPLVTIWVWESVFGDHASFLSARLVLPYLAAGAVLFSAFGVGMFAATLPLPWWLRVPIGGCIGLAMLVVGVVIGNDPWVAPGPAMAVYVAWHIAVAVALLAASMANFVAQGDADLPWPRVTRWTTGIFCVLGVSGAATLGLAGLQDELAGMLHASYPAVRTGESGGPGLYVHRLTSRGPRRVRVDKRHEPVAEAGGTRFIWAPYALRGRGPFDLAAPRFTPRVREVVDDNWARSVMLDPQDGLVYAFQRRTSQTRAAMRAIGKGVDCARFSSAAVPLNPRRDTRHAFIAEPGDGVVWYCDLGAQEGVFQPAPLPGGDVVVEIRSVSPDDDSRQIDNQLFYAVRDRSDAIVGERGVYHVVGGEILGAPAWIVDKVSGGAALDPVVTVTQTDVVTPAVEVADANGAVLWTHDYVPRTGAERFYATLLVLESALRPPIGQLGSPLLSAGERPSFGANPLQDPLLASGRRLWLMALSLVVGVVCAVLARRRLSMIGAPRGTVAWWFTACLLLGLPAMLLSICIESRRRYRTTAILAPELASAPLLLE